MKHSTRSILIILFTGFLAFFTQCTPKYGAYFQNTPLENSGSQTKRYLTENKNVSNEDNVDGLVINPELPEGNLIASQEKVIYIPSESVQEKIEKIKILEENKSSLENKEEVKLSKKELKAAKKEFKKELKKDLKNRQVTNQKIWIGIVVAVAGILVSILASGSIGAVAIIVGIGFIVWGLIEQGSL